MYQIFHIYKVLKSNYKFRDLRLIISNRNIINSESLYLFIYINLIFYSHNSLKCSKHKMIKKKES